jgi:hypothetical protein
MKALWIIITITGITVFILLYVMFKIWRADVQRDKKERLLKEQSKREILRQEEMSLAMNRLVTENKGFNLEDCYLLIDKYTQCRTESEYDWCKICIQKSLRQVVDLERKKQLECETNLYEKLSLSMERLVIENKGINLEDAYNLIDKYTKCKDTSEYIWCKNFLQKSIRGNLYRKMREKEDDNKWWKKF